MKKVTLYSRSGRLRSADTPASPPHHAGAASPQDNPAPNHAADSHAGTSQSSDKTPVQSANRQAYRVRARNFMMRHERLLLVLSTALLTLALLITYNARQPPVRQFTQKDIDAAVLHTLDKNVLPSAEAKAFSVIRRSIVRVRQLEQRPDSNAIRVRGVGTGVVIVDKGVILTNLHVVAGAERVQVQFADGLESDAVVISLQPENDLAVLQAKNVPDDLIPATLRSTRDLAVGDKVVAVGFPFGIGPSASSGIVSGLRREYQSPEGKRLLTNLIQFDAAANPGNSGGPLVTMDGEVVGIVTAILNPSDQDVFIGIAFAVPIENAAAAAGESPF
jgi:S1-C subfamily serine protease